MTGVQTCALPIVVRTENGLKEGLAGVVNMKNKVEIKNGIESVAVRSALSVCEKTFEAALARKENIGTHYRVN